MNMATIPVSNTEVSASPSRPAIAQLKTSQGAPDAIIPGDGIGQANVAAQPIFDLPDRTNPGASSGDQARVVEQPTASPSDRNSPPETAGDETTLWTAPAAPSSRRKNPAKAGGIDHFLNEPHLEIVDAKNSGVAGRDEAIIRTNPQGKTPRHEPISDGHSSPEDRQALAVAGDHGAHGAEVTQTPSSPVIAEITQLVRMRRRWHKAEKSLTLQGKALCRSWTSGDKDEANAAYDRAAADDPDDPVLAMALAPFLDAKARFEVEREAIEKTLRKLARTLPVWNSWALGVKGLGDLRLAVIVGECGDIGSYRNPSCLWKRMGLAVIGDQRQRRVSDASDALEHGYNPERRAIAYVMGTEVIKAQVRRIKDAPETALRPAVANPQPEGPAPDATIATSRAIGPYGQIYLDRKVYEAARDGITKSHANNRAARYMVKRILRDLYAAWKAA